jgi:hypothetical protein
VVVVTMMILAIDQDEVVGALVGRAGKVGVARAIIRRRTERKAVALKVDRVARVGRTKVPRIRVAPTEVSNPVGVGVPARPVDLMVRETLPLTSTEILFQSCHAIT